MKKQTLLALLIVALLATSSCNRYYYRPTGINDPLFTGGGQVHLGFGGSISNADKNEDDRMYLTDLQLGFSPINHLGVVGSYSTYAYRPYNKTTTPADGHIIEAGIGGYSAFGKRKVKMVVDLYAGGGGGSLQSDVNMKLTKLYLQPGIGMRSHSFDAVINLRFSNIQYSGLDTRGHDYTYLLDQRLIDTFNNKRIDNGSYTFYEPGITLRMGYKFVKLQLQAAWAVPISPVPWRYHGGRYTIGLHFNLEDALSMGRASSERESRED